MKNKLIELLCFDLDGVIVNTNMLHIDAWKALFRYYDIETSSIENQLNSTVGLSAQSIIEKYFPFATRSQILEIKNKKNQFFHELINEVGCSVYSDVINLLHLLKSDGYHLAVVSTSSSAHFILECTGLVSLFELIVSGNEMITAKPAPDPYLKAISFFNAKITVAFEDSHTGVMSALSAGCYCVGIIRNNTIDIGAHSNLTTGFNINSEYLEQLIELWLSNKT